MKKLKTILPVSLIVLTVAFFTSCSSTSSTNPVTTAQFMLLDGEGPNAGGDFSRELGTNTLPIFLDEWARFEPSNNSWNWAVAFPSSTAGYTHCVVRLGILHVLAWNPTSAAPSWVSTADLNAQFKTEYGEFVQAAVNEIKNRHISVDAYLVELEANFAGHEISAHPSITNAWIIDWIKWEVGLIKSIDPAAKIIIPLTPTEFRPEESLDNTGDLGKLLIADFVARMIEAGVQFDAFGFNIASGTYDKVDDTSALEAVLNTWSTIDKEIFVWAMGYPADNNDNLPFNHPRAGGYSEEWQKETFVNSLQILLNNPKVIGLSIDLYDFQEPGLAAPFHWGLVGGDRTNPGTLSKRPSFDAVKNYWLTHYR